MTVFEVALLSIIRRGGRFVLAAFGLALGVMAAVALFSLSRLMVVELGNRLDEFGANILVLPQTGSLDLSYGGINIPGVTYEVKDFEASILDQIRHIPDAASIRVMAPKILGSVALGENQPGDNRARRQLALAGVDFAKEVRLKAWWRVRGRLPEKPDEVLLGQRIAGELALEPGGSLILAGRQVQVVGILEETGSADDGLIFIDLAEGQRILGRPGRISLVEVSAYCNTCPIEKMVEEIKTSVPGARVTALKQAVLSRMEAAERFERFSWLLSGLMLLVGSLVVINTMLTSVRERTREIGLMRAVGFRGRQVATVILFEALAIGLAGGAVGYLLGMGAAYAFRPLLGVGAGGLPFEWRLVPGSLLVSAGLAVLGAFYPARRAAQLDPAVSLRGGE